MSIICEQICNFSQKMTNSAMNKKFCKSCMNGDFDIIDKMLNKSNDYIHFHFQYERAFRFACVSGHLEIAQLLYNYVKNNNIMCETNKLISKNEINIHAKSEFAFCWSVANQHHDVARWLYSLGANIHVNNNSIFFCSCLENNIEMVHLLFKLSPNNITKNISSKVLLNYCYCEEYYDMLNLLIQIFDK
jgi:hypothetical protein